MQTIIYFLDFMKFLKVVIYRLSHALKVNVFN